MDYIDSLSELEDAGDGSQPWLDLVFELSECRTIETAAASPISRWLVGEALGSVSGERVGFRFEVALDGWHASRNHSPGDPNMHWGLIKLMSLGAETDELLGVYSKWFELPLLKREAVTTVECLAVALEDGFPDPTGRLIHYKLFFEDRTEGVDADGLTSPERYAELYFNIDLPRRRTYLKEKDTDYRLPLLKFLAGELRSVPTLSSGLESD